MKERIKDTLWSIGAITVASAIGGIMWLFASMFIIVFGG